MDWKGLRVTVKLTVINRQASVCSSTLLCCSVPPLSRLESCSIVVVQVEVVPAASSLVIKALNEPVRDRKKGPKNGACVALCPARVFACMSIVSLSI